ncbi:hypothetical protein F2Q70_00020422 [Brassica cretica]|uniref:Uncharacterized protein n=1 Tax=Brassica cretica TaxID=69181 RepID=A0A3N6TCZ3_BRACR|nr:hypothetical protein F2Q70_00020422 [Brassica cretica]KAF3611200.1 hypothetical protein DY000_02046256 [Brassica cretica]
MVETLAKTMWKTHHPTVEIQINVTHLPHVWHYALFSVVFHPPISAISTTILRHLNNHSSLSDIELRCRCGHRTMMYMWILNLGGHVDIVL